MALRAPPKSFKDPELDSWRLAVWHRLLELPSATVPTAATDPGVKGTIAFDDTYVYLCISTNTWKRALLSTW